MAVDLLRTYDPIQTKLSKSYRMLSWAYIELNMPQPALSAINMAIVEDPSIQAHKLKLEILLKQYDRNDEDKHQLASTGD